MRRPAGRWPLLAAVLGAASSGLLLSIGAFETPEVVPEGWLRTARWAGLLALLSALAASVATDLDDYAIPDVLTLPLAAAQIAAAAALAQTQIAHLYTDWTDPMAALVGPTIPAWISARPHLHGLAWSAAGAATGFAVVMAIRWTASLALGRPALGSGDATLMLLAGSFLGWQPTLVAIGVAPLLCVIGIPASKLATGRSFVAFGPYLAAATLIVLCAWRRLWLGSDPSQVEGGLRIVFSDPALAAIAVGAVIGGTAMLLGLLRALRSVPVRGRGAGDDGE